ncbi:MAG: hypothetical protein LW714_05440, partial [Oxalobacteraceae bacterium]|nr:hypothetical protein [Oxalobacteraceae bacterium]
LSSSNLNNLTTDQVQLLTSTQIQSLTSTQLRGLTSTNFQALETTDVQALTTTQVKNLSTSNISAITSDQLQALTTSQLINFTSTQRSVLTTSQTSGLTTCQTNALAGSAVDPLVLDLNSDGIHATLAAGQGAAFILAGLNMATGWVGPGDGMLVSSKDFGPNTLQPFEGLLPKGVAAVNGPTGLVAMDTNGDGVIDVKDPAFKSLEVYTYNDGVGKLHKLSELDIKSVSVNMTPTDQVNNGNLLGLMGSFTTSDGVTHSMADYMFQIAPIVDLRKLIQDSSALVNSGRVDLTKVDAIKNLSVSLQDVLSVGETLAGINQLTVDGDNSDTLYLASSGSGWQSAGTVTDGADSYHVYVNANAQLMVNDKIHIVIG